MQIYDFRQEIEKLKREIDIVRLFEHFGTKSKKKGKDYLGLCPFHEDHSPSLSLNRGKGVFHCFSCGAKGNVFRAAEKLMNTRFKGAFNFLKTFNGQRPGISH